MYKLTQSYYKKLSNNNFTTKMALTSIQTFLWAIVTAILIREGYGKVEPLNYIPQTLQSYLDTCHSTGDLSQQSGQLVFWTAINQYTSRFVRERPNMTPQQISFFNRNLQEALTPLYDSVGKRKKRQADTTIRIRKEIRAMSIEERRRYFQALDSLKRDTMLSPNVYDFLADFHAGENIRRAYLGPAFGPWHRLYLWILEFFLRQHDLTVTIPYWASVLDNNMDNSADSVIFSPAFYGTGVGQVNDGPFRNWSQINPAAPIVRNVQGGPLFTYSGIELVVAQTRARDIFAPTALPGSNLEMQHGAGQVFVGGTMNDLNTAARDPIFYSHHCFVDQIWERFKNTQRNQAIDPQSDYPFIENDPRFDQLQRPTANAGFTNLTGANQWNLDAGNLNSFSTFVAYEEVPSCSTNCSNSLFLRCNTQLNPPRCVSLSRTDLQSTGLLNELNLGNRKKRQISLRRPSQSGYISCPKKTFLNDVDIRQIGFSPLNPSQHQTAWAYIPVKVVSKRPTEYIQFNKYSLYSMGATSAKLGLKNAFMARSNQKTYETCDKIEDSVGKIKIVGYGLNYKGYAEEYVVVDNRLGVSESIGYLPVKIPTAAEPTEVMIAAFDSCGRVCRPYCKRDMSSGMDSQFTGAVRVTSTQPLQYAYSYSDATLQVWDIPNETACPSINYDNVPVSFFCEFSETWIWNSGSPSTQSIGSGGFINQPLNQQVPMNGPDTRRTKREPTIVTIRPHRGTRNRGLKGGRSPVGWQGNSQRGSLAHPILNRQQLYSQSRRQFRVESLPRKNSQDRSMIALEPR